MKILLINPPFTDSIVADMSDYFDDASGAYPPLGLMYLASYLRKEGFHDVEILDANLPVLDYKTILAAVTANPPDVIGMTALTFNLPGVHRLAVILKTACPGIKIVLGGPHPTIYPDETLDFVGVDYVVLGEGEVAFTRLLKALESGKPFDALPSIGFVRGTDKIVDRTIHYIDNLDELPFPDMELTDSKRYASVLSRGKRTMAMMSSRGCPFKCIYCDRPHLGRKFRARSAANVVDEMELCLKKYGISDVKFFDDTFTVDRRRVVNICDEITRRALKMTWSIRARVNTVDTDLLERMKQAGLTSVSFGIESGNQKVLDTLQKGITLDEAGTAVSACRKLGIEVLGDFIIGSPGERREQIHETIRLARRLRLDYAQFTIMTPYPSTQLYAMGLERGIIKSDYWRDFARHPRKDFVTPIWNEFYTKQQLVGLLRHAYRSFYFRPGYMARRALAIRSRAEFLKKLKAFISLVKFNLSPRGKLTRNFKRQD